MFDLAPEAIAYAVAAAIAAGFVRGLAGFGLSVVLVPVLALAIAPAEAVLIGNISLFLIGLTDIKRIRQGSDPSALPITLIAIACAPVGLLALASISPALGRLLIAMVSLGAFLLVVTPPGPIRIGKRSAIGLSGFFTGFFSGFAGMPGPGMAPYYLRGALPPLKARASMMVIFLVLTPIAAGMSAFSGVGGSREPLLALALFPAVLLGDYFGHKAYGKISERTWQLATVLVLGVAAGVATWRLLNA
jgi:uncharacterized membrane protein YfcA